MDRLLPYVVRFTPRYPPNQAIRESTTRNSVQSATRPNKRQRSPEDHFVHPCRTQTRPNANKPVTSTAKEAGLGTAISRVATTPAWSDGQRPEAVRSAVSTPISTAPVVLKPGLVRIRSPRWLSWETEFTKSGD